MSDAKDEMVTLRKADLDELRKFYGNALAQRREVIMATLLGGVSFASEWPWPSHGDVAEARACADAIIEAAK